LLSNLVSFIVYIKCSWEVSAISLDLFAGHVSELLTVVVLDSRIMLSLLSLLSAAVSQLLSAQLAFVLTVGKQLLAAHVFLLEGPQLFLFLLAFLEHFVVIALKFTLVHDAAHLSGGKSLKVVWLDAMRGEHACLSHGVLCHEIVVHREVLLECSVSLFLRFFGIVTVALFFSHLPVGIDSRRLHSLALGIVVILSLSKHLGKM